jgi:hypothetical protein
MHMCDLPPYHNLNVLVYVDVFPYLIVNTRSIGGMHMRDLPLYHNLNVLIYVDVSFCIIQCITPH